MFFSDLPCVFDGRDGLIIDNEARQILVADCPAAYKVLNVAGSRSRLHKQLCTWFAMYSFAGGESIPHAAAGAAAAEIKAHSPRFCTAEVMGRGRFNNTEVVIIQWVRQVCKCRGFFDGTLPNKDKDKSELNLSTNNTCVI